MRPLFLRAVWSNKRLDPISMITVDDFRQGSRACPGSLSHVGLIVAKMPAEAIFGPSEAILPPNSGAKVLLSAQIAKSFNAFYGLLCALATATPSIARREEIGDGFVWGMSIEGSASPQNTNGRNGTNCSPREQCAKCAIFAVIWHEDGRAVTCRKKCRVFSPSGSEKVGLQSADGSKRWRFGPLFWLFPLKSATVGGQKCHSRGTKVLQSEGKSASVGGQKWHFWPCSATQNKSRNPQHTQSQQDRKNAPESHISDKMAISGQEAPCRGRFFS